MKTIYLTDRSRIDAREECERKRYLNYDYTIEGYPVKGLQRRTMSLPLINGVTMHEGHARVLGGQSVDDVVKAILGDYAAEIAKRGVFGEGDPKHLVREQGALLEGMLRAFVLEWVPRILEEYDIVSIEKPMQWEMAPGLVQNLRFDVVLRRKADGQLIILDFKSMPYVSDAWSQKLETSRQTSLYITAAQELFGEPVEIAYLGVVKGSYRKDTAQSSPFFGQKIAASPYTYAYALKGDVGNVYQTAYTAKKGYQKIRTYEEMPTKEWLEWLWMHERQTVKDQFTFNPPIAPSPAELDADRELIIAEELEFVANIEKYEAMKFEAERTGNQQLAAKAQRFLDLVAAPKRKSTCYKYGMDSRCSMVGICYNDGALENVLVDGEFEPREPHHATELEEVA